MVVLPHLQARIAQPMLRGIRAMSVATSEKHLFLIYAPDKTDEGALERRLSVRSEHLQRFQALKADGVMSCVQILLRHT
jgi:hypothetical protein